MHLYNFIFGLSTFSVACQSQTEKISCSYKADFIATTTTSAEFTSGATIAWGGLALFRTVALNAPNENRIELSITDPEGVVIRVLEVLPHAACTLKIPTCIWTFPTKGWKTSDGETPQFISIVFRPDGDKLEHADVKIYADGIHRITTLLVWQPPHNSDNTRLIADAAWNRNKKDSS